MKVAVTGGNGYLGTALKTELLRQDQAEVLSLTIDQVPPEEHTFTDFSVESLTEQFRGVDVVVHLAAVRGGTGIGDFSDNERITENLLLAMRNAGVKRFVFSSSIAVYSDTSRIPWREDQPCQPVSLYGISKLACEALFHYYARNNGFSGCILRFAPVYGEHDRNRRMIANFIRQAKEGQPLTVNGKSTAKRDFIYRDDVIQALKWAVFSSGNTVETYNIGSGEPLTNLEIATAVTQAFHSPQAVHYLEDQPETMPPAYSDITKARQAGFSPDYTMASALERIVKLENDNDLS